MILNIIFETCNSLKLHSKFYGCCRILEKNRSRGLQIISPTELSTTPCIPCLIVYQLKNILDHNQLPVLTSDLPLIFCKGNMKVALVEHIGKVFSVGK